MWIIRVATICNPNFGHQVIPISEDPLKVESSVFVCSLGDPILE